MREDAGEPIGGPARDEPWATAPLEGLLADLLESWQEPVEAEIEAAANEEQGAPDVRTLAAALTERPEPEPPAEWTSPLAPWSQPPLAEALEERVEAPGGARPAAEAAPAALDDAPELQLPAVILSVEGGWTEAAPEADDVPTDFPLELASEAAAVTEGPEPGAGSLARLADAVEPAPAGEAIQPATGQMRPRDRFVAFECAGRLYGLPLERVAEVERVPHLTVVPGAPPAMCGLINRRGDIVPLIDLRLLLSGSPADDPHAGRLVMAAPEPGEEPLAFLVDQLAGLASFERSEIEAAGADAGEAACSFVAGRATHRGRDLLVLDTGALREETHRCFAI